MPIEKVYLELTNRCNLDCTICYRKSWNYKTSDMSPKTIQSCVQQIKSISSIKEVVLGGIGEPTFCKSAEQVMYALKDKYLTLTTNGTIMHKSMKEAIAESVKHVVISIDGLSETFFNIRKYTLEHIVENIKCLNELKKSRGNKTPLISFQMVISETNKEEIFGVIDLAVSLNVSAVIISNLLPATKEEQDLILYKPFENTEMQVFFKKVRNYALKRGIEVKLPEYQLKTERRCRFIDDNTTMITASGDVVPCYRFAHDGTEVVFGRQKEISAHKFGNITEKTLEEIWESAPYSIYRSVVYNNHYPSCTDCDLADGCDMVRSAEIDCYGNMPSCGDCLWARKLIYCV